MITSHRCISTTCGFSVGPASFLARRRRFSRERASRSGQRLEAARGSSAARPLGLVAQPVKVLTKVGDLAEGPLLLLLHFRHWLVLRKAFVVVPRKSIFYIYTCCCCFLRETTFTLSSPAVLIPPSYPHKSSPIPSRPVQTWTCLLPFSQKTTGVREAGGGGWRGDGVGPSEASRDLTGLCQTQNNQHLGKNGEGQGGSLVESCTILSCWEVEEVEGTMNLTHFVKTHKKNNLIWVLASHGHWAELWGDEQLVRMKCGFMMLSQTVKHNY